MNITITEEIAKQLYWQSPEDLIPTSTDVLLLLRTPSDRKVQEVHKHIYRGVFSPRIDYGWKVLGWKMLGSDEIEED